MVLLGFWGGSSVRQLQATRVGGGGGGGGGVEAAGAGGGGAAIAASGSYGVPVGFRGRKVSEGGHGAWRMRIRLQKSRCEK